MNRQRQVFAGALFLVAAIDAAGCDSKAPGGDIVSKPPAPASVPPPAAEKSEPPPAPKVDLDRSKLPAALQTDAFHYFGFGNTKPMDMEMTTKPDKGKYTGAWSTRMSQLGKGTATFVIERTGSLSVLFGNENDELRPDGIYVVSSDKEHLTTPQLELPTGLAAGKSWNLDTSVTSDKGSVREKMRVVCKGFVLVKIGATSYNSLYVVGTGTFDAAGQKSNVTEKEWFVKDIGMVKMQMVETPKDKPTVTFDMVWKPTDSKAKS